MVKQHDSRRSLKANNGQPAELPEPVRPLAPTWLDERCVALFENLVDEAVAAGVPTSPADAIAFGLAARLTLDYQTAADPKLRARIGRDLYAALDACGCSPRSRVRMGIRSSRKKAASQTAKLLKMRGSL